MSILSNKILIFSLVVLFALFRNARSENVEEKQDQDSNLSEDSQMELEKRAIDKMRFYGGLGKRFYDSYETIEDDGDEMQLEKRLDRMKYFGGLGKRNSNYLSDKLMNAKRLDKMKYFGGLGKRSDFYPMWKDNQLRYLMSKKSNFDRMRFLGNLGK